LLNNEKIKNQELFDTKRDLEDWKQKEQAIISMKNQELNDEVNRLKEENASLQNLYNAMHKTNSIGRAMGQGLISETTSRINDPFNQAEDNFSVSRDNSIFNRTGMYSDVPKDVLRGELKRRMSRHSRIRDARSKTNTAKSSWYQVNKDGLPEVLENLNYDNEESDKNSDIGELKELLASQKAKMVESVHLSVDGDKDIKDEGINIMGVKRIETRTSENLFKDVQNSNIESSNIFKKFSEDGNNN